jgi:hypothetical protein
MMQTTQMTPFLLLISLKLSYIACYVAQAGIELTMYSRLVLNSVSFCVSILSAQIMDGYVSSYLVWTLFILKTCPLSLKTFF